MAVARNTADDFDMEAHMNTDRVTDKPLGADSPATVTHYRTREVDGVKIFYREAGPEAGPVVLLLHGFPTSSHMFRNLIPALADRYHVIAPDYPGYGQSDMPDRTKFDYTFDRFAELVDGLLDQLGVTRYARYLMDYRPLLAMSVRGRFGCVAYWFAAASERAAHPPGVGSRCLRPT
jgi:pimeloyl-ACP methyl ester carboxylesterase